METELRITDIFEETEDTKTYFLERVDGKKLEYEAGQFLTLLLEINGRKVRRSYSFGSAPGIDKYPFITIKRKTNGEISRFIQDNFFVGSRLKALPAAGRFTLSFPLRKSYFCITGGSGIVPAFSLIKSILNNHEQLTVFLLNQSRSENDIIYKNELEALHHRFQSRFTWQQLFSKPLGNRHSLKRLSNLLLEEILLDFFSSNPIQNNVVFYLCGPQAIMRMAEFTLKLIGFPDQQIKKEQFVVDLAKPVIPLLDRGERSVSIRFEGQQFVFSVNYPQTILDAALNNNIELPYSCKAGICSACLARVDSGKIIMGNNEVLTDKEVADHKILTCVAYAATDVELSIG